MTAAEFPAKLFNWSGNRSGGVRRLFDQGSGRPGDRVFKTSLLHKLEVWAETFASKGCEAPRIILLVGGPGNGKTEAIEAAIFYLDTSLNANEAILKELQSAFSPTDGIVPRVVDINLALLPKLEDFGCLSVVQDASAETGNDTRSAAELFVSELEEALKGNPKNVYLCCVNRGVLDDALIKAIEKQNSIVRDLLEEVSRSVSLLPNSPKCWPLPKHPAVAVWPMDLESLFVSPLGDVAPLAHGILNVALDEKKWPAFGTCAAGTLCPFCFSRAQLAHKSEFSSLLKIIRWFELASGKRWSFRDFFSLISYLLSGYQTVPRNNKVDPCGWAEQLIKLDESDQKRGKPSRDGSTAIFNIVAAQYQHALFHIWDYEAASSLLKDIKEIGLEENNTAMGLYWFLMSRRSQHLPTMIRSSLLGIAELMDPSFTDPNTEVVISQKNKWWLRDIDVRFSHSVNDGLDYIKKSNFFSKMELDLIRRLAELDELLSNSLVRKRRPQAASRIQRICRDFSCRLVRRTIGVRTAAVFNASLLENYQSIIENMDEDPLYEAATEVEQLLNNNQNFEISLTTTFGQPLPPPARRAMLIVAPRPVRPLNERSEGRPPSPVAFLWVGVGASSQPIALTYDLFRAIKELKRGMSLASLPQAILALLDTTRARISGPIVRDLDTLQRAVIRIGDSGLEVKERRSSFSSNKGVAKQ